MKVAYTERMKNKELHNYFKKEISNWVQGSDAGEFGIDDLIDICYTALQEFDKDDSWSEIDMTLTSLVDDNFIEEEEKAWVLEQLNNEE
jgi:peptide subunit release factor 1 (eRF1)